MAPFAQTQSEQHRRLALARIFPSAKPETVYVMSIDKQARVKT